MFAITWSLTLPFEVWWDLYSFILIAHSIRCYIVNLLLSVSVEDFWTLLNILSSYDKKVVNFFWPHSAFRLVDWRLVDSECCLLSITVGVSIVIYNRHSALRLSAFIHSSHSRAVEAKPRRNHVTTVVRRSVGRSPSGASRNAVLAGNGSYVLAQSLVSAHGLPSWRLAAPALKCTSPSLSFPPDRWPSNAVDACECRVQTTGTTVKKPKITLR